MLYGGHQLRGLTPVCASVRHTIFPELYGSVAVFVVMQYGELCSEISSEI